jgi:hypothetical protein
LAIRNNCGSLQGQSIYCLLGLIWGSKRRKHRFQRSCRMVKSISYVIAMPGDKSTPTSFRQDTPSHSARGGIFLPCCCSRRSSLRWRSRIVAGRKLATIRDGVARHHPDGDDHFDTVPIRRRGRMARVRFAAHGCTSRIRACERRARRDLWSLASSAILRDEWRIMDSRLSFSPWGPRRK